MNIKLESSETSTLKVLQEKVTEASNMVNSYNAMLSTKYQLPATGKFSISADFTSIVEVEPPTIVVATADPVPEPVSS